tara:strand:+ start:303 stop:551 length:249 start_codon:yes stop_codon:yes gene_type:complete
MALNDPPPMICGGIYGYEDYRGVKVEATLASKETLPDGTQQGTLLRHGHAPELVAYDSDRWQKLTLLGRPASPRVGRPRKEG